MQPQVTPRKGLLHLAAEGYDPESSEVSLEIVSGRRDQAASVFADD